MSVLLRLSVRRGDLALIPVWKDKTTINAKMWKTNPELPQRRILRHDANGAGRTRTPDFWFWSPQSPALQCRHPLGGYTVSHTA